MPSATSSSRFADDSLVMDKWFALQATSRVFRGRSTGCAPSPHTPAYDANNPNKVRSLLGSYIFGNWKYFHASRW